MKNIKSLIVGDEFKDGCLVRKVFSNVDSGAGINIGTMYSRYDYSINKNYTGGIK